MQMQSQPGEAFIMVKKEASNYDASSSVGHLDSTSKEPIGGSSFSKDNKFQETKEMVCHSVENTNKEMALYDPVANRTCEIEPILEPKCFQPPPYMRRSIPSTPSRVMTSIGAFTIQCANCFKWRLIPTKEKYEAIRECILEKPFYCNTALEWRPDISCDDPTDLSQDGSRLWAIDKPNIARPPRGWQRLLRIRGEGSTKFADVYYQAPSGKRLRSMSEIQKYLMEHPEYMKEGTNLTHFSFQIPRPLQENYVKKRPRLSASFDNGRPLEASKDDCMDLQLGRPTIAPPPFFQNPAPPDPVDRPAKK